jgi:hypothetical protein
MEILTNSMEHTVMEHHYNTCGNVSLWANGYFIHVLRAIIDTPSWITFAVILNMVASWRIVQDNFTP